jgi:MFS transporter, DHA3 family, macrolide efflux protein
VSLFKNRNFSILLSGQLISTLGNNLYGIALPWYVYTLTNSKSALAFVGLSQTLPAVVGLFSGVLVDRWRKRTTMVNSDLIRAAFCFILLLGVVTHFPLWVILAFVLALEVVGQFFSPASNALFPLLVKNEDLTGAQGIMQSSSATAKLIGTISGGALMATLGAPLLFLLDGVSFVLSSVSLLFIRVSEPVKRKDGTGHNDGAAHNGSVAHNDGGSRNDGAAHNDGGSRDEGAVHGAVQKEGNAFYREWREGLQVVTKSKYFLLVMLAALVTNFALAPFEISMTAWVKGPMHGSAFDLGIINAGFFVGVIAGGVLLGIVAKRISQRGIIVVGLTSIGVFTACFGLLYTVWAETILCLAIGIAVGSLNGSLGATFITLIPERLRGRVFGLTGALGMIAMPVGMAVFGVLMVHIPLTVLFFLIGAICILSGSSLLLPIPNDSNRLSMIDTVVDSGQAL